MRPQMIIDTETTGLDPARHQIWEIAMIERDCGAERLWRVEPNVLLAEEKAMEIGRFYERTAKMRLASFGERNERYSDVWDLTQQGGEFWSDPAELAPHLSQLLDGATLIAANPTFDAGFLSAFLDDHDCKPAPWHYRLRDIGSISWGWLTIRGCPGRAATPIPDMDASTDDFARALGVGPDQFERHSALGDCRLIAAMLGVMESGAL